MNDGDRDLVAAIDRTSAGSLGLSSDEAAKRLVQHGPNLVSTHRDVTYWDELLESLREPLVLLLLAVGVLYFVFGELREALIVLGVIVTVALTEAGIEWRAGKAVAALSAMAEPKALVWRDGVLSEQPVETLVPGDVLELRSGSRIPADGRLITEQELAVDESLVTGESEPVRHAANEPELLGGTLVVRGAARAEITRTGTDSTLGRIATLVAATEEPKTPLQRRMGELARTLLWVAISVSVFIPVVGVLAGQPPQEMLLTGLSLAFATIPEELAVLIVVVLGLGSLKLARRGAIVRQLRAAETLGAVTTICTDKTGTLTLNRMELARAVPATGLLAGGDASSDLLLRAAAYASEGNGQRSAFDPMDAAIRSAAPKVPEAVLFPFEQSRRIASGYVGADAGFLLGVKGAPESVLARCTAYRTRSGSEPLDDAVRTALAESASGLGSEGRVLGVASRILSNQPISRDEAESDLVFEGALVLHDPVRPEAAAAMAALSRAGVGVTIITGDQSTTAARVAEDAGIAAPTRLLGTDLEKLDEAMLARRTRQGAVVARAQPDDKLRIVRALTQAGGVVMVTGDGVNDAPALRAAAVGVAMGRAGSDAAREAAGVVLTDDSFATLVESVREGRRLFDNFRKAIRFYLAVKLAIIVISAIAAILGYPLPFAPVQIVILELFMDLGAALAYVSQPADSDVMRRPPRDPNAPFFGRSLVMAIIAGATTLAILVLAGFLYGLSTSGLAEARALALVTWFPGHAALGFVMAFDDGRPNASAALRNPILLAWLLASVTFAAVIVLVPTIGEAIGSGAVGIGMAGAWGASALFVPFWMTVWLRRVSVSTPNRPSAVARTL